MRSLKDSLGDVPLIAILRGIKNHEVVEYGHALYQQGFRCIEVPLNSPNAIESIRLLVDALPADCLLGAGTVMTVEQVEQVYAVGGRLIVMPHADVVIVKHAKSLGMQAAPGVADAQRATDARYGCEYEVRTPRCSRNPRAHQTRHLQPCRTFPCKWVRGRIDSRRLVEHLARCTKR